MAMKNTAILGLAACISEAMNKAGMCGQSIKYIKCQPNFLLFFGKE